MVNLSPAKDGKKASEYNPGDLEIGQDGHTYEARLSKGGSSFWKRVPKEELDTISPDIMIKNDLDNIIHNEDTLIVCHSCGASGCDGGCVEIELSDNTSEMEVEIERSSISKSPFRASSYHKGDLQDEIVETYECKECDDYECRDCEIVSVERTTTSSGALSKIEPEGEDIEPYTLADTGINPRVLPFINAPGNSFKIKKKNQIGQWIVGGSISCPFCIKAKELLSRHNQTIYFLDTDHASSDQMEWLKKNSSAGYSKIPVIFLDNKFIGGYDKLKQYIESI